MEKKREGGREAAGEVFLASDPLYRCFLYWGWEREAAKVALRFVLYLNITRPRTCISCSFV
jgi:hypothetical protein